MARTYHRRRMCRMRARDRPPLRHRDPPDSGDARRDRRSRGRRRADARGSVRQRAAGAGRGAARPGAGALPADGDDGESDRAEAPGRPGDVLVAEEHSHVVVYEFGGPAAARRAPHASVCRARRSVHRRPGARRDARRRGRTSTSAGGARAREHPQRRGRARVAARRARGGRRRRARARARRASRRRAAAERRRRARRARRPAIGSPSTRSRCASRKGSGARSARCSPGPPS